MAAELPHPPRRPLPARRFPSIADRLAAELDAIRRLNDGTYAWVRELMPESVNRRDLEEGTP
jgi:hypothetical protein